jgi:predicted kinase
MRTLIITRGLPGSGKSTRARAWVAEDERQRTRVNRDDIRRMLHGRRLGTGGQERQVTLVQLASIRSLLRGGHDVVCDDTNLMPEHVEQLRKAAEQVGAEFEVWDMTDVDIDVCTVRDHAREGDARVGEDVIRDMWSRYQATLVESAGVGR